MLRRLVLGVGAAAATALLAFHARLLWLRVSGGSILDASVGAQWAFSAVLLGALLLLRRRAFGLPNGRSTLVFWLLVALLHWNQAARLQPTDASESGVPIETLVLLPAGAGLAFAAGAAVLASHRARASATLGPGLVVRAPYLSRERSGWRRVRAARPPPLLTSDGILAVA